MLFKIRDAVWHSLTSWLVGTSETHRLSPNDFEVISSKIRVADVFLVEGHTRVGNIIKRLTRSSWSHAALCIGRLDEVEELSIREKIYKYYQGPTDIPLLVEAEVDRGTTITPISEYRGFHVRIARPIGLTELDSKRVAAFAIARIGQSYNVKQLLDLARFLLPWWALVPRQWHSSLFNRNAGEATRNVCSSLIAGAFQSVDFPILPLVEEDEAGELLFYRRNPKLYTPRDFDYSPFFKIYKFPMLKQAGAGHYKNIRWSEVDPDDLDRVNYLNAEDVIFVSQDTKEQSKED